MEETMQKVRLRSFGHMMRRHKDTPRHRCERLAMNGFKQDSDRPKKYEKDVIIHDMKQIHLTEDVTHIGRCGGQELGQRASSQDATLLVGRCALFIVVPEVIVLCVCYVVSCLWYFGDVCDFWINCVQYYSVGVIFFKLSSGVLAHFVCYFMFFILLFVQSLESKQSLYVV